MAVTKHDIEVMMRGIAPVIAKQITEALQPVADLVVQQRQDINRLQKRLEKLEGRDTDGEAMKAIEG